MRLRRGDPDDGVDDGVWARDPGAGRRIGRTVDGVQLRIPGGAGFLSVLGADLSDLADAPGDAAVDDVSPAQLDEAIDAMAAGHLEYVGLHDGASFLQAAGEGDGPYLLEVHPGDGSPFVRVPEGVTLDAVRYAFHGSLAGDPAWPQAFRWQPAPLAPPPAGDLLKRLFGRG